MWPENMQEVQARGPEVILTRCLGALERAHPQFPWGYSWAPTLSAKGGGDRCPERLQEVTREQGPRGKGKTDEPHTTGKTPDESELQKAQRKQRTHVLLGTGLGGFGLTGHHGKNVIEAS